MEKSKLKVGARIFIAPYGINAKRNPNYEEVTRVGNKYVYAGHLKFCITTGVQDSGQYMSCYKAYHTLEDWELEEDHKRIAKELSFIVWEKQPLEVLKQVKALITPKTITNTI